MSALFSSLPPETSQKCVQDPAEATVPPNKRAKLEPAQPQNTSVKEAQLVGQDHVAAALIKITTHISSSRKFTKASELLRKLIADHNIGQEHSKLVFEVVLYTPVHSLSCSHIHGISPADSCSPSLPPVSLFAISGSESRTASHQNHRRPAATKRVHQAFYPGQQSRGELLPCMLI